MERTSREILRDRLRALLVWLAPVWLPDAYAAWRWRAYHGARPDVQLTAPVVEYRKQNDVWGGPECGLGYGGQVPAGKGCA